MTVTELYELVKAHFPDVNSSLFLALYNKSMRIIAEDTRHYKTIEQFTTDGNSVYDLSAELTYEPVHIKLLQLAGDTLETAHGNMLDDVDI